jgi:NAD(P)-dependent dehydrogenase (short-subunit alcohol dehydrogenase family)
MFRGVGIWAIWTQFFPPSRSAQFTEKTIPSQKNKVFIVTGGSSGIGFELSKILYGAGARVYILTRSESNAKEAIKSIEESFKNVDGIELGSSLKFIHMDLEDLASVQSAAREFASEESQLNVLFNNAGVANVRGKTKQGLEYQYGVNSVGHVLLERLLKPILTSTASTAPANSVRVVWPTSILVELMAPPGGVPINRLDHPSDDITEHYCASKVGNWYVASEFAKRTGSQTGVVSIAGNPGSYQSNIWRNAPWYLYYPYIPLLRKSIFGAYTYLWMALSEEVTLDEAIAGRYATCDGRWHPGQRKDLLLALKGKNEGGTGQAAEYFDWCESKIAPFLEL